MAFDAIAAGVGTLFDAGAGAAAEIGGGLAAAGAEAAGSVGLAGAELGAAGAGLGAELGATGTGALAGAADVGLGAAGGALDVGAATGAGAVLDTAAAVPAAAPAVASGAGAVTQPLAFLDSGAATGVLDTGSALGFAPEGTNVFATEAQATQEAIANGTFDAVGANSTNFAPAVPPEITSGTSAGTSALNSAGSAGSTAGSNALDSFAVNQSVASAANAPTSLAAPAASGGGSVMGGIGDTLKSVAPYAALGGLGYNLLKGEPSLPKQGEQLGKTATSLEQSGQNLTNIGTQNLQAAANNQITPSQASEIEQWKQNQRNQLYQFYASKGLDPSSTSDYQQGLQQIDQQAVAMKQQFIDQLVKTGLGETGQGSSSMGAAAGALTNAANMQISQDNAFQQSISSAFNALGTAAALSSIGTKKAA